MQIEIPDEFLDDFLVQALQDGLDTVRKSNWVNHTDDIVNNVKVEAAFITLLEYYMCHSDFNPMVKRIYRGSNTDS